MKKLKLKYLIVLIGLVMLFSTVGAFYYGYINKNYTAQSNSIIPITIPITGADDIDSINVRFSRPNITHTLSTSSDAIAGNIINVSKPTKAEIEIIENGNSSFILLELLPHIDRLSTDKNNESLSFQVTDYSNNTFDIQVTDTEDLENSIFSTNLNIGSLVAKDEEFIYSIESGALKKYSLSFIPLNSYSYSFSLPTQPFYTQITDIKTILGKIYLRLNNGEVYEGVLNDGAYLFTLFANSYADIGIQNNSLIGTTELADFTNIKDYQVRGNTLYIISEGNLSVYYIGDGIGNRELHYSIPTLAESLFIDDGVFLINASGQIDYVNNDRIVYYLYNESGNIQDISIDGSFNNYRPNLLTGLNINENFSVNTLTDMQSFIGLTSQGTQNIGGETASIYNSNSVPILLSPNNYTSQNKTIEFGVKKTSTTYGNFSTQSQTFDINIPITGFGIEFSRSSSQPLDIPLNVGAIENLTKVHSVGEGLMYLHFKAYDFGGNSSNISTIGPFVFLENSFNISNPYINSNQQFLGDGSEVEFIFQTSRKLDSATIQINDDLGNTTSYTLSDLIYSTSGTSTGVNLIKDHTYVIPYEINQSASKLNFDINGVDQFNNRNTIFYEYQLNPGWFQVIGITKTNTGIGSSISKAQQQKGFKEGIESSVGVSSEINTSKKFQGRSSNFKKIPTLLEGGVEVVNHDVLKSRFSDFTGKSLKNIGLDFFYEGGNIANPFESIRFLNGYYYFYDGNLDLRGFNFSGNGVLLVNGTLTIGGDLSKNYSDEIGSEVNALSIYVTGNINIHSNVKKVSPKIFTNERLTTLSVGNDVTNILTSEVNNILEGISGKIFTDLNNDGRADLITYTTTNTTENIYKIYMMSPSGNYTDYILTPSLGLRGEYITFNTASTNYVDGKLLNDIQIHREGGTIELYFIDAGYNSLTLQ